MQSPFRTRSSSIWAKARLYQLPSRVSGSDPYAGLETVKSGVARATCHRVLSPDPAFGSRYSIPYFQMIAQQIHLHQLTVLKDDDTLHPELRNLVQARGCAGSTDAVNYSEYSREVSGLVALIGRIKSHPDVAERHYPERYREIFQPGVQASAY